jgi:hypothetical protein
MHRIDGPIREQPSKQEGDNDYPSHDETPKQRNNRVHPQGEGDRDSLRSDQIEKNTENQDLVL